MGLCRNGFFRPVKLLAGVLVVLVLPFAVGCQTTSSVSVHRLIAHQALIDFSGLKSAQTIEELKVSASIPEKWEKLPAQKNALYSHQQWRSPSRSTGVGVALIHLPWPMSARTIIWFAKTQYSKQPNHANAASGQLLNEWTDAIGREWFEAENAKFHVRGYAVTSGFDAWIVYSGYRAKEAVNPIEVGMAGRTVDSILPIPLMDQHAEAMTASK